MRLALMACRISNAQSPPPDGSGAAAPYDLATSAARTGQDGVADAYGMPAW
jgi:hypothetical protein